MSPKAVIITWDHKEQPDWAEVNFAIIEVTDPVIREVDSGSDQFAVVVCPVAWTPEQAQKWFNDHEHDNLD